ncbi:SDR family oxidoreductase [Actinomadura scrupuli]|uniref:SDR family oxidoreductase n=1 Tax=Actinomadura scrupuli TaxID=559629 RepID=UPI003D95DE77
MRIAVAGGTGQVGKFVVDAVRAAGHEPTVISRSAGVDITTGSGLAEALQGTSAVIDVSNVTTTSRRKSVAFFEAGTRNLLGAGRAAGVSHHVALSIVGIDRVDFGYYEGKRRQEELLLAGPVPASILRATQFHEFAIQVLERGGGPFALVPRMATQPIAAREVAHALVELAVREPAGMAPDLAGPERRELTDMARQVLRARGGHRVVVPLRLPGAAGRAMAGGALLPAGPGPRGKQTFAQWLAGEDVLGAR